MNFPIECGENSRRFRNASDPSKATVCLICGYLFIGSFDDHLNEKDHRLFMKEQILYFKTCNHLFNPEMFDDKTNDMLI